MLLTSAGLCDSRSSEGQTAPLIWTAADSSQRANFPRVSPKMHIAIGPHHSWWCHPEHFHNQGWPFRKIDITSTAVVTRWNRAERTQHQFYVYHKSLHDCGYTEVFVHRSCKIQISYKTWWQFWWSPNLFPLCPYHRINLIDKIKNNVSV